MLAIIVPWYGMFEDFYWEALFILQNILKSKSKNIMQFV